LQPWSLLRKALIRAAKTSQTAETLGKIKIEIYGMRRVHAAQEEKYIKIILAKE
jgi:hypothetical protein